MLFSVFTHSHLLAQKSGEEHLLFVHSEVLTDAVPAETTKQTVETQTQSEKGFHRLTKEFQCPVLANLGYIRLISTCVPRFFLKN